MYILYLIFNTMKDPRPDLRGKSRVYIRNETFEIPRDGTEFSTFILRETMLFFSRSSETPRPGSRSIEKPKLKIHRRLQYSSVSKSASQIQDKRISWMYKTFGLSNYNIIYNKNLKQHDHIAKKHRTVSSPISLCLLNTSSSLNSHHLNDIITCLNNKTHNGAKHCPWKYD